MMCLVPQRDCLTKIKVLVYIKGTVSQDFLYWVFSPKQLLLVPLEMSKGRLDFFLLLG